VKEALEGMGLGDYADLFDENGIESVDIFPHLTENDLSFMKIGHRRKFMVEVQPSPPASSPGLSSPFVVVVVVVVPLVVVVVVVVGFVLLWCSSYSLTKQNSKFGCICVNSPLFSVSDSMCCLCPTELFAFVLLL